MSRRWRYPRSRRGITFQVPQTATPPPGYRDQAGPRPRFAARLRRGSVYVVPAQSGPPPAYRTRDRFFIPVRRGRFWVFVPATVIVAPPRAPDSIGHDRPRPGAIRRGRFTVIPQPAARTFGVVRARSRWSAAVRRGRFLTVPPAPVVQSAPPFVPQIVLRRRLNLAAARRGRYFAVPPAPVVAVAPTWIPPILAAHRPMARLVRRVRFGACPVDSPRPPERYRRRPYAASVRHGRRFDPPWTTTPPPASTWPPDRIGSRRRPLPAIRRRPLRTPPWPQIAQTPPPIVPTTLRMRRRLVRPKRGCFLQWPVYQATQPVVTDLPDLSATETVTGRIATAEALAGRVTGAETVTGHLRIIEAVTGRTTTTEDVLGRIESD